MTGSTNADLLLAAADGAAPGLVRAAAHQTAGRGRLDRHWTSAPGASLLVSVLLEPVPTDAMQHLVGAVALAMAETLEALVGLDARIKWPNDLVVDDRKLAGVLAETAMVDGAVTAVVVGIGCNLGPDAVALADRSTATDVRTVTGRVCDREALLDAFLRRLDIRLDALDAVGADAVARSATLGRRVLVQRTAGDLVGVANGIAPDGALLLLDDAGTEHRIVVGDVVHLRPA